MDRKSPGTRSLRVIRSAAALIAHGVPTEVEAAGLRAYENYASVAPPSYIVAEIYLAMLRELRGV